MFVNILQTHKARTRKMWKEIEEAKTEFNFLLQNDSKNNFLFY